MREISWISSNPPAEVVAEVVRRSPCWDLYGSRRIISAGLSKECLSQKQQEFIFIFKGLFKASLTQLWGGRSPPQSYFKEGGEAPLKATLKGGGGGEAPLKAPLKSL